MQKAGRSRKGRRRRAAAPRTRRRTISRAEYDELVARIAAVEIRGARYRVDLDIQLTRIGQMQDEINLLKRVLASMSASSVAAGGPALPSSIES